MAKKMDDYRPTIVGEVSGVALLPWAVDVPTTIVSGEARQLVGAAVRDLIGRLAGTEHEVYVTDLQIAAELVDGRNSPKWEDPEWCLLLPEVGQP